MQPGGLFMSLGLSSMHSHVWAKFWMICLCWNLFNNVCSKGWPQKLFEMETLSLLDYILSDSSFGFLLWAMMRPPGMMPCADNDSLLSQSQEDTVDQLDHCTCERSELALVGTMITTQWLSPTFH